MDDEPAPPTPDPAMNIYAKPQKIVAVEPGRSVNLHVTGRGSPTVILSAGAGGWTLNWGLIQPRISRITRVVSYDRAGSGHSEPGPLPRTTSAILSDLRTALRILEIEPPYILVGQSSGSFDVQLFAYRHLEDVAGIVLVDPADAFQDRRLKEASVDSESWPTGVPDALIFCEQCAARGQLVPGTAPYRRCVPPADRSLTDAINAFYGGLLTGPGYWRSLRSEIEGILGASSEEITAARRPLGQIPLIVLTAEKGWPPGMDSRQEQRLQSAKIQMHEELAALSSCGERRTVMNTGHNIHIENPRVVSKAIEEVLNAAGATNA